MSSIQTDADIPPLQILLWMLPVMTVLALIAEHLP